MTRTDLARHINVTRQTVYNWERSGAIPAAVRVNARRTIFGPAAIAAAELLAEAGR